jgi:hypothetical protein
VENNPLNGIDPAGLGTWNINVSVIDGQTGLNASYTLDSNEQKCCKIARVQRFAWDAGTNSWEDDGTGYYQAPDAKAPSDQPQGPGSYVGGTWAYLLWGSNTLQYRPANTQRFKLVAKCAAGQWQDKTLSETEYDAHEGAHYSHGETPTAPYGLSVSPVIPFSIH